MNIRQDRYPLSKSSEEDAGILVVYVIDASVWVSRFLPEDIHHELSVRWTSQLVESRTPIYAPTVLLPEVAVSVSRVIGSYGVGHQRRDLPD